MHCLPARGPQFGAVQPLRHPEWCFSALMIPKAPISSRLDLPWAFPVLPAPCLGLSCGFGAAQWVPTGNGEQWWVSWTLCRLLPWWRKHRAGSILGAVDVSSSRISSEEDFSQLFVFQKWERQMRREKGEIKRTNKACIQKLNIELKRNLNFFGL